LIWLLEANHSNFGEQGLRFVRSRRNEGILMDWQLQELVLAVDGSARKRLVGGVPFRTWEEAARYAAELAKTYPKNGYDKRRRYWWSEDWLG
jgi:hypothetical protein